MEQGYKMKAKKSISFSLTLILILIISFYLNLYGITVFLEKNTDLSSLVPTAPVSQFGIQYNISGPISVNPTGITGYPGNGTKSNPYRIEGYNLTTTGSETLRILIS